MRAILFVLCTLASCESTPDTCPADDLDEVNQMLPADCGCGAHFVDGCVSCEVYVDGEIVGTFNVDCRDVTCCGR